MWLSVPAHRYAHRAHGRYGEGEGVNIFPAQIEEIIKLTDGASSEYQVMIDHLEGKDIMTVFFETDASVEDVNASSAIRESPRASCMTPNAKAVAIGELHRSGEEDAAHLR